MDDPLFVSGGQRGSTLDGDWKEFFDREWPAESFQPSAERFAFDVFHHNEHLAAGLQHIVNARDVVMPQNDSASRFLQETLSELRVFAQNGCSPLESERCIECDVVGQIN